MRVLTHNEKVTLVILLVLALAAVSITTYLAINQADKNAATCLNQKLHVLNTGTEVQSNFKEKYQKYKNKIGRYTAMAYDPPMNSSDVVPADWNQIAKDLASVYDKYDAFVVLVGKDTLAYTASALAFMLENLGKPVVLTDQNLVSALVLASQTPNTEVMVASHGELLRGCRTVASSTVDFASPNYPPLDSKTGLTKPTNPLQVKLVNPGINIVVVKLFPGINPGYMAPMLNQDKLHGIILEIWNGGTTPSSPEFLKVVNALAKKGVVIVAVAQSDQVEEGYETNMKLLEAGVLSGGDMTTSAAYTKLAFLLANVEDKKLIGQLMEQNFRGEMGKYNLPIE